MLDAFYLYLMPRMCLLGSGLAVALPSLLEVGGA